MRAPRSLLRIWQNITRLSTRIAVASAVLGAASTAEAAYFTPAEISLNRSATTLTYPALWYYQNAHTGFYWNSGDDGSASWRPQGIAGHVEDGRKFLIVSWAGQEEGNYDDTRGARISVVDVTSMSNVKYRHVLLLDSSGNVFPKLHAGGVAVKNDYLYVADSRNGHQKIRVFDLRRIENVSKLGYGYVLEETPSLSYRSPVTPSFLSYDFSRRRFLVGTFYDKEAHTDETPAWSAALAWYSSASTAASASPKRYFHRQMQGAASDGNYLWTTHSWGRNNASHLHVYCYSPGQGSPQIAKAWTFPPGLEDIHLSDTSDNLWSLTEFGPHEGGNRRVVFAIDRDRMKPSGGC